MFRTPIAALVAFALMLGGCAGRTGSSMLPAANPPAPAAGPAAATAPVNGNASKASGKKVHVAFKIAWKSRHPVKRPHYIPATARSISFAVNGEIPQYGNAPQTQFSIDAPVGTDTFAIAVYDENNGQGNVLSRAMVTKKILLGVANTVSASLDGVVTTITISLSNPAPNAGVPATVNVNVAALDADGNTIVGPGDYSTRIKLTTFDSTNSQTIALSTNSLPNAATTATLTYNGGTLAGALVIASATGVSTVATAFAPTPTFYQFALPNSTHKPQFIAAGSDGNMWFTETVGNAVARITPAGVVTEFAVPTAASNPQQIIGASDGNLWFSEFSGSKIARVTTGGAFTEFSTLFANDGPAGLVDRGDGNIWYAGHSGSHIGYLGLTSGSAGETGTPTASSGIEDVATAPDNNIYYTESAVDKIGRIPNLFSAQSEITLTAGTQPAGMVRGPDGNVWFAELGTSKIGRLSPNSFSVTGEFPTVTPNAFPTALAVGLDGAMWFTESGLDRIGRITTGGSVTEYRSPITGLALKGIAVAPDGSIWFAEPGSGLNPGRIGKLVY